MKSVAIYRDTLLPVSETFISEQVRALREFHPTYLGLGPSIPSLWFEGDAVYLATGDDFVSKARRRLFRSIPLEPFFYRRVQKLNVELIHAHFASDGANVSKLAEKLRVPLVVTLHGYDVTVLQDFKKRYSFLWMQASAFFCVSQFIRLKALEAGFPASKLIVHHIGVDSEKFRPPAQKRDRNLVLFVGRLVEKKGCESLLRAMQIVRRTLPDAYLVMIGNGPLLPMLKSLASALKINTQFLGSLPSQDIQMFMQKAQVFCGPSQTAANGDSEGLGMVFLEAQASGLPVVSTLHGGIPEAVCNGVTGLLTPEGDFSSLAKSLLKYLSDQDLAVKHGMAGPPWIREVFDLTKQTKILEGLYSDIVNGKAIREPAH